MKIICRKENEEILNAALKPFEALTITLVEKGMNFEGVGIQFEMKDLKELILFLHQHFLVEKKRTLKGTLNGRIRIVSLNDVLYIEGLQRGAYAICSQFTLQLDQRLYQLEEELYPQQFVRIQKSYLVNLLKIEEIEPSFHGRLSLRLENGDRLEVSRSYRQHFKQAIGMEKKHD